MRKIDPAALLIGSLATLYHFPDFRKAHDADIYAVGDSFRKRFLARNPGAELVELSGARQKYYVKGFGCVEITEHVKKSGIDLLVEANRDSRVIEICGVYCFLAKPTTLFLIKRVHSQFGNKHGKNVADLEFLQQKEIGELSEMELRAYDARLDFIKSISRSNHG